jgi:D-proline reductase (dithiol) PrdB
MKDQVPFDPAGKNDLSFREIPKTARTGDVVINHNFYDHSDAEQDLNCIFPLQRFEELADEGIIGDLAAVHYSFMGRIFSRKGIMQVMAPDLVERLRQQQVDVLFQIPT